MAGPVPLALLLALTFSAGEPAAAPDDAAIVEVLHALCAAYQREDADYVERTLDPGFILVDSTGTVTTRAQEAAELRSGTIRYDMFRNHGMQVRRYGDAALVHGITSVEGEAGGERFAADFRFTDTLVRRGDTWVLVASHASRLAPPAEADRGELAVD
jgi:ketosteroid isomerase-like protein